MAARLGCQALSEIPPLKSARRIRETLDVFFRMPIPFASPSDQYSKAALNPLSH